jgi:hypothetical protein
MVFVWDIDGSGGDFFGWSTAFSMINRIAISAPSGGGTANRGQVKSLTSSAKNGVRLELTFWVTTQPISKVFHGFER